MAKHLEDFDQTWVSYEQIYVLELMLIEADARLFITEAIETEVHRKKRKINSNSGQDKFSGQSRGYGQR